MTWFRY